MKPLLRKNVGLDGKLNTDKFQRAVMQYINTADRDTGRSPAQVIFGRELRDFLPAPLSRYKPQKQWLMLQEDRENALRKRALQNTEKLDLHTRHMAPLQVHDTVQVQNQVGFKASRWDVTGMIVEVKSHDQYLVKIHGSGRVTLRNRKFLKKIIPYCQNQRPNLAAHPDVPVQAEHQQGDDQSGQLQAGQDSGPVDTSDSVPVQVIPDVVVPQPTQAQPAQLPQDPAQHPQAVQEQPVLRRSARPKVEPQRLNIGSWKGQTYVSEEAGDGVLRDVGAVHNVSAYQDPRLLGQHGTNHFSITAPHSVAHYHGLHHSVPGGGGDISGYALPSSVMPSSYQPKYWTSSNVQNTGLPVPQLGYGTFIYPRL